MVQDARGHVVPAGADGWSYKQQIAALSLSVNDIMTAADLPSAEAKLADLTAAGVNTNGTLWWIAGAGRFYGRRGGAWAVLQDSGDDTGWVNVTVNAGFAAHAEYTPQVRRIGNWVRFRGGFSNTGLTAGAINVAVGVIPVGFRPPLTEYHPAISSSVAANGRFAFIAETGAIQLSTATTLGNYFLAFESWYLG